MTLLTRSRFALYTQAAAPIALLLFIATIVLRFPPEQYSFYPQCPIHYYFGILCPGCGTTRALAALLHGNVKQALSLNPLTMLMLPIAIGYAAINYRYIAMRKPLRWPQPHPFTVYGVLTATIVFTIARNL
jgi:hypothetical protein